MSNMDFSFKSSRPLITFKNKKEMQYAAKDEKVIVWLHTIYKKNEFDIELIHKFAVIKKVSDYQYVLEFKEKGIYSIFATVKRKDSTPIESNYITLIVN